MATTLTFSTEQKAALTAHLGLSGASTDDQVRDALIAQAFVRKGAVSGMPPKCPLCSQYLPNLLSQSATTRIG